jgi:hypothetical protein
VTKNQFVVECSMRLLVQASSSPDFGNEEGSDRKKDGFQHSEVRAMNHALDLASEMWDRTAHYLGYDDADTIPDKDEEGATNATQV